MVRGATLARRHRCAYCDSDNVQENTTHPTMPYRCRACRKFFSIKSNTVMQSSKLGPQTWALGAIPLDHWPEGHFQHEVAPDLDISQKAACSWPIAFGTPTKVRQSSFSAPLKQMRPYIGGKEKNKHEWKKQKAGRGTVGKAPVGCIKDRGTNQVRTQVVEDTKAAPYRNLSTATPRIARRSTPTNSRPTEA